MKSWKIVVTVLFIALILPRIIKIIQSMGFHKHVYNHSPGSCRTIKGIDEGSEDIQTMANGLAFISSGLRFIMHPEHGKSYNGQIFLFDFNHPDQDAKPLEIEAGDLDLETFNPHGISLWSNEQSGTTNLLVINHPPDGDTVEKFKYNDKTRHLIHLETFKHKEFKYLNDLVATGPSSFYYTNYQQYQSTIERYMMLHWANVGYFNGQNANQVLGGLHRPNGINISPDGKYVYIVHPGGSELIICERGEDNNLTIKQNFQMYHVPDNIDVDPKTGDIWAACHPVGYKATQYLKDPSKESPSLVLKMKVKDGSITDVSEIYANDGSEFSGSSVAVEHRGKLLIGSVQTKLLFCDMDQPKA